MMRIAGRGSDGNSKPINTTNEGFLKTQTARSFVSKQTSDTILINPGATHSISRLPAEGSNLEIAMRFTGNLRLRVGFYGLVTDTHYTFVDEVNFNAAGATPYKKYSGAILGSFYTVELINEGTTPVTLERIFIKENFSIKNDQQTSAAPSLNVHGKGVKVYAETVVINNNQTHNIFNYPAGKPVIVEVFEVAHSYVGAQTRMGLAIFLSPRDSSGVISESITRKHVRRNGKKDTNETDLITTPSRLTGQAIKDHGSSLFDILHYDEGQPAFKFGLKKEFHMPNGGELKIANNATGIDGLEYSYMVIVREF